MRLLWRAMAMGALMIAPVAHAGGQEEFATLLRSVAGADSVEVTHLLIQRTPAPFASKLPCTLTRVKSKGYAHGGGEWLDRLRAALDLPALALSRCDTSAATGPGGSEPESHSLSIAFAGSHGAALLRLGERGELSLGTESQAGHFTWSAARDRLAALRPPLAELLAADKGVVAMFAQVPESASGRLCWEPRVQKLPEVITRVPPIYPDAARAANDQGRVMVQARLTAEGKVAETTITRSIPSLDAAAVCAIEQWKFTPARRGRKPVSVWVAVPVKFTLK